jgi:hypothetical protein
MRHGRVLGWVAAAAFLAGPWSVGFPRSAVAEMRAPAATTAPHKVQFAQYVHGRVAAIFDDLQKDKDYSAASDALATLFDQAVLYSPADKFDAIREADFALRMVNQLSQVSADTRDAVLPVLLKHDNLARTLVFLIRDDEHPSGVYDLLNRLQRERGDKLDQYNTLAAAICVVHSRERTIQVNENLATSADPIDIFDYYIRNENKMMFGIKNVPADLLIYVVDTTASIPEMEWALNKYAGTADVGKLFFTIKYDYAALKGNDKMVTVKGFNLQNILAYGGVCIDQAYFATTVGKSIGIPTTIDEGESAEAGHAWVGFLQASGNRAGWNFNAGRYQAFQGVEGSLIDPQTRQHIPDSYVSLLGEMISTKSVDRQNAVALTDAARRLGAMEQTQVDAPPADDVIVTTITPKPRKRDVAAQLALIESAIKQSAAFTPAWFTVRDLASARKLTLADKKYWSDLLLRLGSKKYPEFTLSVLVPMVKSIDDPKEQDLLWNNMLPLFAGRMDLSAAILMSRAKLWEAQNQNDRACQYYLEVVGRYSNDGPFVLAALSGAEKLLKADHHEDRILPMYEQAWSKTKKPGDWAPEILAASNWVRIGKRYAQELQAAGENAKASEVEAKLGLRN